MKYKKKLGGSDNIPQPMKQNNVTSTSGSISSSIKKSMAEFKNMYTKIIEFIKNNFIFSLLVCILLSIYISLFLTDTVTQAELDAAVVNKKCSELTDTCPFGKRKDETLDCDGDNCTTDKCCVDNNNCSSYTGTCPANYVITTDSTVQCTGDNGSCTQDSCCKKTCDAEPTITQADCSGADTEYRGASVCTGTNNACQESDCCYPRVYCDTFTSCPTGQMLKSDTSSTVCPNGVCDASTCCQDSDSSLDCSDYQCTAPNTLKSNPDIIECGDSCTDSLCCDTPNSPNNGPNGPNNGPNNDPADVKEINKNLLV